MYKKILVPLDGSKLAEVILPHVWQLASLLHSEVHFLQIIQLVHSPYLRQSYAQEYQALPQLETSELRKQVTIVKSYLDEQVQKTAEKNITAFAHIAYGPVAATIINTAIDQDVDLIAMASHGASGLQGVYYGSVAAGVLQRVDRPLLIVRSHDSR